MEDAVSRLLIEIRELREALAGLVAAVIHADDDGSNVRMAVSHAQDLFIDDAVEAVKGAEAAQLGAAMEREPLFARTIKNVRIFEFRKNSK